MFTIPSAGSGIILVARPSASTGTITNATNAYDLPSSRPDDPPYTTKASRATVTGSVVAGTVDYAIAEFNTFPSKSKSNFSICQLTIGYSSLLSASTVSTTFKTNKYLNEFVTSDFYIDYQINGSNWINITKETCFWSDTFVNNNGDLIQPIYSPAIDLGIASNSSIISTDNTVPIPGVSSTASNQKIASVKINASSFSANLTDLKVRFRLGTCTNNGSAAYKSSGSYDIWDIRANIS